MIDAVFATPVYKSDNLYNLKEEQIQYLKSEGCNLIFSELKKLLISRICQRYTKIVLGIQILARLSPAYDLVL